MNEKIEFTGKAHYSPVLRGIIIVDSGAEVTLSPNKYWWLAGKEVKVTIEVVEDGEEK